MNEIKEYTGKVFSEGIPKYNKESPSDCTKTVYVQFKLINSKVQEILSGEKKITAEPSEATSLAYHEYTRKDYSWQNNITAEQTHYTENMKKTDKAPGMIFALGEDRTVSGRVFEDAITTENETKHKKLGNGQYDDSEHLVSGVKVDLLDINTDGTAFSRPWFGQLMTGPQLMAYLIQVNMWLEKYQPKIEL